jgi:hypothetical protein
MFDEPSNAGGGHAPQNLPIEPDDMFSGVDTPPAQLPVSDTPQAPSPQSAMTGGTDALGAGVLKRKGASIPETPSTQPQPSFNYGATAPTPSFSSGGGYPTKEPVLGRIILFVLSGLIIVGLSVGGWWVYTTFFKKTTSTTPPTTTTPPVTTPVTTTEIPPSSATPAPQTSTSGISNDIKNDTVLFGESVDTDRDGLDDIREQQIGTSVTATDTDKDGLTDGEEVLVWKTNPLNADTDGDGYLDGDEVKHGYNPLGPGKLPAGQASRGSATSSIGR